MKWGSRIINLPFQLCSFFYIRTSYLLYGLELGSNILNFCFINSFLPEWLVSGYLIKGPVVLKLRYTNKYIDISTICCINIEEIFRYKLYFGMIREWTTSFFFPDFHHNFHSALLVSCNHISHTLLLDTDWEFLSQLIWTEFGYNNIPCGDLFLHHLMYCWISSFFTFDWKLSGKTLREHYIGSSYK